MVWGPTWGCVKKGGGSLAAEALAGVGEDAGVVAPSAFASLSLQKLLAKLQSWERLEQTTGLNIR